MNVVPYIPDNAPFTPEQRAYLNGFFAGLFSRAPTEAQTPAGADEKALRPLTILFGSQTGNAEALAKRAAKEAGKQGFAATVNEMAQYPPENLPGEQTVLLITSTHGDGDPPDNAKAFWEFLSGDQSPRLPHLKFSVLALGDTNYAKFCECGKNFDRRFAELGARRVHPRVDCDVEFEEPFRQWLEGALKALANSTNTSEANGPLTPALSPSEGEREDTTDASVQIEVSQLPLPSDGRGKKGEGIGSGEGQGEGSLRDEVPAAYSRQNPFPARLLTNRKLNGAGSAKDTRHFEISLADAGLNYEVGDALGVMPTNCPQLVQQILQALGYSGEEAVPGRDGKTIALRDALVTHCEITKISQPFLKAVAQRTGDDLLKKLTTPGVNGELTKFLWGREIIDVLRAHPNAKFSPAEFVGLLKKLQPRLYSISSSPKAHPGQVHLTVSVVRYESLSRARKGVCSTFLAERVNNETFVPVFVHRSKSFRPPADASRSAIMVGPGTGIAPFRAFLEERRAVGATGKNWLFFGEQGAATDFLYRQELEALQRDGTLTRLDTAFSRDQEEKIYVQHRMLENASELFEWLEAGAHFYVCGDASRMAKDVDVALHRVIELGGSRTAEQADDDVRKLRAEKRYQRDVY